MKKSASFPLRDCCGKTAIFHCFNSYLLRVIPLLLFVAPLFFSSVIAQNFEAQLKDNLTLNIHVMNLNTAYSDFNNQNNVFEKIEKAVRTIPTDDHVFEEVPNLQHNFPYTSGGCVVGTKNRFTGSYHSNFYIGNNGGTNVLMAWGYKMATYANITASSGSDVYTPTLVPASNYGSGVPLEVQSASPGASGSPLNNLALRTSTKLYFFGDNLSSVTSMSGFGGAALTTAASDVTAKLPTGVAITDIAQMVLSNTAFGLVTNSGSVFMLSNNVNLEGDNSATSNGAIWHQVKLVDGSNLSGVTKFSLSSSGAFALTSTGKIYYWGTPANVAGVANTSTSYKYAYDMSAQIPSGTNVTDLVVVGKSNSTLFMLCSDNKVYGCGLNTFGVLGINNSTQTFNQAIFKTVKGTDGITDLTNIVRIDGNTEADLYSMGAMDASGNLYGWGDDSADLLGVTNGSTSSKAQPLTVKLFNTSGFSDFSIAGHFTIGFYSNGSTDSYYYVGHSVNGSQGSGAASIGSGFVDSNSPTQISSSTIPGVAITFNCSNTQPTITVNGTLSVFSACNGSASSNQTFTVTGANLSSNITITAPSGFEVSTASGSGFGSTATLTQTGGNVSTTTIYIRIANNSSGSPSGNISCTSTGATTQTISVSGTVNILPSVVTFTGSSRTGTGTLTLSGTASTGATLDWYSVSTGGSVLSGGTSTLSFITPSISTTTNYFIQARNTTTGCISAVRSLVTGTVNGSFSAGTIGSDQIICNGATPTALISMSDASGGTGTITNQWQSSTDNITYTNISGATLSIFVPSSLSQTTYYRRSSTTTNDGTVYSNIITITVNALPTATAAVGNARTGSGPVIISASASIGATLDWYSNASGGTVLIGGNGVTTFTTPNISVTTTYYAQARDNTYGCLSTSRLPVVATINGSFSGGSIVSDQTICSGSSPSAFTSVTLASGGTGTISYQWQSSTVSDFSSAVTTIPSTNTAIYTPPGALVQTTYYRRSATTTTSSDGTVYSNIITVTVNPLPAGAVSINGSRIGSGTVVIGATVNTGETTDWYLGLTGGTILSGGTGTLSFITPSIASSTTYYAQARNVTTGCIASIRTSVLATINAVIPTIATSGSLNVFSTCTGIASSEQSFSVSGSNLNDNIIVTAPAGYELTTISGSAYTSAITLIQSSGTVSNTSIYVRLSNSAINSASGNITCVSNGAITQNIATGTGIVNAIPTIGGSTSLCVGSQISLTGSGIAATNAWTSSNTSVATVLNGLVNGIMAGTSNITYTNNNGCSVSTVLTVNAIPTTLPVVSPSGGSVCQNSSVTYTMPTGTGYHYLWGMGSYGNTDYTIPTGGGGLSQSDQTATLQWKNAGTYAINLSYEDANGCWSSPVTITKTINALPVITFTTIPSSSVCANTDIIYTTQPGQTNYTWSVPGILNTDYTITSGGIGVSNNTVTLKWITTGSKTVTVNYTNSNGCVGANTASNTTTVNALPTVTFTATPASSICASADVSYTTQSGQSNYIWNVPGTVNSDYTISSGGTGNTNNTVTLKWLTGGTKTVTVNYNNSNGCAGSGAASNITTVNILPTISAVSGTTNICTGSTTTLAAGSSASSPVYNWYDAITGGNLLYTGANFSTPSINANTTYYVDVTSGSCIASSRTAALITVITLPTISGVSGTTAICSGNSTILTAGSAASAPIYNWYSAASGGSSLYTGAAYTTPILNATTTYYADITSGNCISGSRTPVVVTVNALPTISAQPSASVQNLCLNGSSTALLVVASPGSGIISTYQWYSNTTSTNNGGVAIGTNSSTYTPSTAVTGTLYYYCVITNSNGCTVTSNVSGAVVVNALPSALPTVSSTANSICINSAITYLMPSGQDHYEWGVFGSYSGKFTITAGGFSQTDQSATIVWNTPGSYTLTLNYKDVNGCWSVPLDITKTIVPLPTVTFDVSPASNICAGTDITYTTQSGQNNYIWTVPGLQGTDYSITSGGISSTNNTVTLKWLTSGTKTVTVNYSDNYGCSSLVAATNTTVVNTIPAIPSAIHGYNLICANSIQNYLVDDHGFSYNWTIPSGWSTTILNSVDHDINLIVPSSVSNGDYILSVKAQNFCGSSESSLMTLTVGSGAAPVVDFQIDNPIQCITGNSFSFTDQSTPASGTTITGWSWNFNDLSALVTTKDVIHSFNSPKSPHYDVFLTVTSSNGCTASKNKPVVVNARPTSLISGSGTICNGSSASLSVALTGSQPWSITYSNGSSPVTVTGITSSPYTFNVSPSSTKTYTVTALSDATGCNAQSGDMTGSAVITVNTLPSVTLNVDHLAVCQDLDEDASIATTYTTQSGQTNYQWNLQGNDPADYSIISGGSNSSNILSLAWNSPGLKTVGVNYTDANGCSASTPFTITVNVNPSPTLGSVSQVSAVCDGSSAAIQLTGLLPNTNQKVTYNINGGTEIDVNITSANDGTASFSVPLTISNNGQTLSVIDIAIVGGTGCSSDDFKTNNSVTLKVNPLPIVTVNSSTVCAGNTATVTATPGSGVAGDYNYVWTVPDGVTNPGNVSSFTTIIAGIYSVVITQRATSCISASASGTVTLNTLPIVSVNSNTICSGSSATVTATPGTGAYGDYSYIWTVPSGVSNPGNVSSFATMTGGSYSVVITRTATSCASANATGIITVNELPTVGVNNSTVCSGAAAVIAATPGTGVAGDYNFVWTVPDGVTNPGNVSVFNSAIAGIYSVVITKTATSCVSASASGIVALNALPVVNVNSAAICSGTTATITASPVSGLAGDYSYLWTVPSGASDPGNVQSFTTMVAGSYSVVISKIATSCSSVNASGIVTVHTLPVATVIADLTEVCQDRDFDMSKPTTYTTQPGNTNYQWKIVGNSPADYTLISGGANANNTLVLAWNSPGIHTVKVNYTDANGCTAAEDGSVDEKVNPSTTLSGISQSAIVCAGSNAIIQLTGLLANLTQQITYNINGGGSTDIQVISDANGAASFAVPLVQANNGQILTITGIVVVGGNGCSEEFSTNNSVILQVNSLPVITGVTALCQGSNITLSGSGTAANTNPWQSSNTEVATVNNYGMLTGIAAGNAIITYMNNNGCAQTISVNVNALPVVTFTAAASANSCLNTEITYTTQSNQNNYLWNVSGILNSDYSISSGGLGSTDNTVTLKWLTNGIKTVTVNYNNSNGCSGSSTASNSTTVNLLPSITGTTSICAGSTEILSGSGTAASNAWASLNTSIASVVNGSVTGISAGTTNISYTNIQGCTASTNVTVNALPASQPSVSPLDNSVCGNTLVTYTMPSGQLHYEWGMGNYNNNDYTIQSGGISQTDNTVTLLWKNAGTYVIDLKYKDPNSCWSALTHVSKIVSALPTASISSNNGPICSGNNASFIINGTAGAVVTYNINSGSNTTVTLTGGTATVTITGVTSDQILTLVSVNDPITNCSQSISGISTVTVNHVPAQPTAIQGIIATCASSSQTYEILPVSDAINYTWTLPIGWTGTSTDHTISVITSATSGKIKVVANNGCGPSIESTLDITISDRVAPVPDFTINDAAQCITGNSFQFNNTSTGTIDGYIWDFADGSTGSTLQSPTYQYSNASDYDVKLTVTGNGCTSSVAHHIVVDSISVSGGISGDMAVCSGTNNTLLTLFDNTGKIQWQSSQDNAVFTDIVGATSSTYTAANLTSTTYYRTVVKSGACNAANSAVKTVTVNALPIITVTADHSSECQDADLDASKPTTYTTQEGQTNYIWEVVGSAPADYSVIAGGGNTNNSLSLSWNSPGDHRVKVNYTDINGCTATNASFVDVNIIPAPTLSTVTQTTIECNGNNTSIQLTGLLPDQEQTITYNINGGGSTDINVLSNSSGTGSFPIQLASTNNNEILTVTDITIGACSEEFSLNNSVTLKVKAIPAAPTVSVVNNCDGTSTLTAGNYTGTLLWSTNETTPSISVTNAAVYSVTQSITGCISNIGSGTSAPKTKPAVPTISVVNNCDGTSTLTAGNYTGTLLWNTGAVNSSITVSNAGTYSVSQTVNGCSSDAGTGIAAPKIKPASPVVSVVDNCDGTSTLTAGNYSGTLLWSNNTTTTSIVVMSAGTYSVTQTMNGCTSDAATGVASPKAKPSTPSISVADYCNGTSTLTAGAFTGTLLWSNNATAASISVNIAGAYTVSQTVNGCISDVRTGIAAPKIKPAAPTVTVVNNCDNTSTVTASNYSGTLLWNNNATTASITVNNAGTYTVSQTVNGCISEVGTGITSPKTKPSVPGILVVDNCDGTSTLTANGSSGTLLWSNNATTAFINVTAAGNYTLTQTINGCTSDPVSALASPKNRPLAPVSFSSQSFCSANNSTIANLNSTGSSIQWYAALTGGSALSNSVILTSAHYYASQTVNGCESDSRSDVSVTINNSQTPSVTLVSNAIGNSVCSGNAVTFTATSFNTGGGAVIYTFKKGNTVLQSGSSNTYTTSSLVNGDLISCDISVNGGTCLVSVTASSSVLTMIVNSLPVILISPAAPTINVGSSVILNARGAVSYSFTPSTGLDVNNQSLVLANPTSTTTYTVIGTDANHCIGSTNVVVTVNPIAAPHGLSYHTPNVFIKGSSIMPLSPTVSGGVVINYSVSSGMPAGLSIDPSTGIISGTPTATCGITNLTVTATNTGGSTTATLSIKVVAVPDPPIVQGGTFIIDSTLNVSGVLGTVTNSASGLITVWCDNAGNNCETIMPALPTQPGLYTWHVRSLDTANNIYSTVYKIDTIRVLPKVPAVKNATYYINGTNNPANISVLVTGSNLNYYLTGSSSSVSLAPTLPSLAGVYNYAVSQTVNGMEGPKISFTVTILNSPITVLKTAKTPILQEDGSYNIAFKIVLTNNTPVLIDSILLIDDLRSVFPSTVNYSLLSLQASGNLQANSLYNGNNNIQTLTVRSQLVPNNSDSLIILLNIKPNGFKGDLFNSANTNASTQYGSISELSADPTVNAVQHAATKFTIPAVDVVIPDAFSPNHDGINDHYVIIRPINAIVDLQVFNRWGNIVYKNTNYQNEWDGKGIGNFLGLDLLDGTYYYIIKVIDKNTQQTRQFVGYLTLKR